MTENSQDRSCVSRAVMRGTASVNPKTTIDARIDSVGPCSGGNHPHSTFARFSEPLDFRLFQQYLPQADIRRNASVGSPDKKTSFKARVFVVRSANNRRSECVRLTVLPAADHAGNRRADDGRQPK